LKSCKKAQGESENHLKRRKEDMLQTMKRASSKSPFTKATIRRTRLIRKEKKRRKKKDSLTDIEQDDLKRTRPHFRGRERGRRG